MEISTLCMLLIQFVLNCITSSGKAKEKVNFCLVKNNEIWAHSLLQASYFSGFFQRIYRQTLQLILESWRCKEEGSREVGQHARRKQVDMRDSCRRERGCLGNRRNVITLTVLPTTWQVIPSYGDCGRRVGFIKGLNTEITHVNMTSVFLMPSCNYFLQLFNSDLTRQFLITVWCIALQGSILHFTVYLWSVRTIYIQDLRSAQYL